MHYIDALARHPPKVQYLVNARLRSLSRRPSRRLGHMKGLIEATQTETRIEAALWDEFIEIVKATPVRVLAKAVRHWAWSRAPAGLDSDYRLPLVRVTARGRFEVDLLSQAGHRGIALTPAFIHDLCDDLVSTGRWRIGVKRAQRYGLNLALHTMWATFDNHGKAYGGLVGLSAVEIACDLGFDSANEKAETWTRDVPLLVLEYDPSPIRFQYPTMVEAWGSDPPNYYFTPAVADSPWGETRPWRNPPGRHVPKPMPEVVHAVVAFDALRSHAMEVN